MRRIADSRRRRRGDPIRLATKLIALIAAAVAVMLIVDGYFEVRRERRLVRGDMEENAQLIGRLLKGPIVDVWAERGMERALELIDDVNREEGDLAVRWVWLGPSEPADFRPRAGSEALALAGKKGGSVVLDGDREGPRLYTYVGVRVPDGRTGALELSESLRTLDARAATRIERLALLLGGLLAASAVTIVLLGFRLVGRPLGQLAAKAERVGAGDLSGPLELKGAGELDDLARGLNRMCDDLSSVQESLRAETEQKIDALEQLRHADRLRTVGRLASGVAHELGTPLSVVSGRAALIQRGTLDAEGVNESAEIIRTQANRMTHIIRQLLDFARRHSSEKRVLAMERVVSITCELIATAARNSQVVLEISMEKGESFPAIGNESEIQQVVSNLLMNAVHAMPTGGTVRIELTRQRVVSPKTPSGPAANYVRVVIEDEGEGISKENLPLVFEPFFTTKDVGSGTGLGLSIVYGIVEDHAGWIEAESTLGEGSRFTFYLPEGTS